MAVLTRQLVQLSFEGIAFPYKEITREFSMREYTHEYPHSPGGAVEKLGRKLWEFNIDTLFHGDLLPPQYRDLWPTNLAKLIKLFEEGKTGNLVLPQVGVPIRAFCTNGKFVLSSGNTSGESATLHFKEDQERLRLIEQTVATKARGLTAAQTQYAQITKTLSGPKMNPFDVFGKLVSSVLAYRDQFDLYSNLLEAKCLSVINQGRMLFESSPTLRDLAEPWPTLRDLMHEMVAETVKIYKDQQSLGLTTTTYVLPSDSTLSNVSFSLFRTSSRASELMALNNIADPLLVPAGTVIRYYKDAA